jgi:hypothetical protein
LPPRENQPQAGGGWRRHTRRPANRPPAHAYTRLHVDHPARRGAVAAVAVAVAVTITLVEPVLKPLRCTRRVKGGASQLHRLLISLCRGGTVQGAVGAAAGRDGEASHPQPPQGVRGAACGCRAPERCGGSRRTSSSSPLTANTSSSSAPPAPRSRRGRQSGPAMTRIASSAPIGLRAPPARHRPCAPLPGPPRRRGAEAGPVRGAPRRLPSRRRRHACAQALRGRLVQGQHPLRRRRRESAPRPVAAGRGWLPPRGRRRTWGTGQSSPDRSGPEAGPLPRAPRRLGLGNPTRDHPSLTSSSSSSDSFSSPLALASVARLPRRSMPISFSPCPARCASASRAPTLFPLGPACAQAPRVRRARASAARCSRGGNGRVQLVRGKGRDVSG